MGYIPCCQQGIRLLAFAMMHLRSSKARGYNISSDPAKVMLPFFSGEKFIGENKVPERKVTSGQSVRKSFRFFNFHRIERPSLVHPLRNLHGKYLSRKKVRINQVVRWIPPKLTKERCSYMAEARLLYSCSS